MKKLYNILFLFLFLILSSCIRNTENESDKLFHKLLNQAKTKYKVSDRDIILTYDLISDEREVNSLFNPSYSNIINNKEYLTSYLQLLETKEYNLAIIRERAKEKVKILRAILANIDSKYNILNFSNKYFSKLNIDGNEDSLMILQQLHKKYGYLPIFLPQFNPVITSYYGHRCITARKVPSRKRTSRVGFHKGIDLQGGHYSDIFAASSGKIVSIKHVKCYGNMVLIDHGHGFQTRYAHLSKIFVQEGQHIMRGQKLGLQGNTGRTTGHHLHFEILYKDKALDPYDFIGLQHKCAGGKVIAKRYTQAEVKIDPLVRKKGSPSKNKPKISPSPKAIISPNSTIQKLRQNNIEPLAKPSVKVPKHPVQKSSTESRNPDNTSKLSTISQYLSSSI